MPAGFRFLCKLPRDITHEGLLAPQGPKVAPLLERLNNLSERLGPAFAQLPNHYGPERFEDLAQFLRSWPRERLPLCLELRHSGWFRDPVRPRLLQLLEELRIGRVHLDTRAVHGPGASPEESSRCSKPLMPIDPATPAPRSMVRFIGSEAVIPGFVLPGGLATQEKG